DPVARKMPSALRERVSVAKNATWPLPFAGATMGIDSTLKRSNVPPPGAGWPVMTTARIAGGGSARAPADEVASAARAIARRASGAAIAREYREVLTWGQRSRRRGAPRRAD